MYNLPLRREPSPTRSLKWPGCNRVQISCNTSSAYHMQHLMLRATWYEGTTQLSYMLQVLWVFCVCPCLLFVGCLTSRIWLDNFTCCHIEIEVADQTFYLTQSQYTDTEPTSPRADPINPGAWQGSHWSANFEVTGMTRSRKIPSQAGFEPRIFRCRGGRLSH